LGGVLLKKKTIFIVSAVLLIIASISVFSIVQNQKKAEAKEIVEQSIENYLYKEKKYSNDDIADVKLLYSGKMDEKGDYYKYTASVYYKDEPDNEYLYYIRKKDNKADFISIGDEGDIQPSHEKIDE